MTFALYRQTFLYFSVSNHIKYLVISAFCIIFVLKITHIKHMDIMTNIRLLFVCLMVMASGMSAHAELQEDNITQGMPVLKVNIGGKSLTDQYQTGAMTLYNTDGSKIELGAKFKTRGATAKQYGMKPSFNMKLRDENGEEVDTTLCGLRQMSSWILDAMAIDRICMRNRVAFDIWNDMSKLPYETNFGSRNGTVGQFVEVYINDTYKGIYCMTDRINRKLFNLKKPDVTDSTTVVIRGVMYKHGTNDIGNQSSRCFSEDSVAYVIGYHDAWELVEPEDYAGAAAWAPLDDLYANDKNYEWVQEHYYMEQLADYQIFITALSIQDNWGNKNSIISARNVTTDGNKHRFVYTPWDLDTSLGGVYNGSCYDGNYTDWKVSQIMSASTMPIPFSTCSRESEYRQLLRASWQKARTGALSVENVQRQMYKYRDLFVSTGAWQRSCDYWAKQKYKPCYVEDLGKEVDLIVEWYKARFKEMDAYFGTNDALDIIDINGDDASTETYDLRGMRVTAPGHGIYIQGGKKIMKL